MADEAGQVKRERLDPEREARRRVALAQIRQYGDPVLRMKANEVETFDGDLGRLVERMKTLMQEANGVGLAANQVGVLQRVLVLQPPEEEPFALVNPMLATVAKELETDDEGCLSLQGVTVPVERQRRRHGRGAGRERRPGHARARRARRPGSSSTSSTTSTAC